MIQSLTLPKAAGLPYANGDVRHLTPQDANSAQSISQSTRNLAERDNILAEVINQLIAEVNNKEQIIDIQVPRIALAPSQVLPVANFRIPAGFEARLLNATTASTPATQGRLEILWSSTYGASTGTSIVSTLSEITSQSVFYGTGEFIVRVTNIGTSTIEVCGDVQITMRPVAEIQGSLLSATVISGGSGGTSGYSGYSGVGVSGFSGARGLSGFSGYSGLNGAGTPAYTTLSAPGFTMPAGDDTATATLTVGDNSWMTVSQIIYVGTAGYMTVRSKIGGTQITASNPAYTGNAAGGTSISAGVSVSPGGLRGYSGYSGTSVAFGSSSDSISYVCSGNATGGSVGDYVPIGASGTFSITVTTISNGSQTFKITHGTVLGLMQTGDLTITLPSPFTSSNTSVTVTVDDAFQVSGQTYKDASGSTWKITLPSGYSSDTKIALTYLGIAVV